MRPDITKAESQKMPTTDPIELVRQLIALPAPPGEEAAVRDWLRRKLETIGYATKTDTKGNLLVTLAAQRQDSSTTVSTILVTAHMDEIALMITKIEDDGKIRVAAFGGAYAWKWGEGPVDILTRDGAVPAILSFGSIHTNSEKSVAEFARKNPLSWDKTYLYTGLSQSELQNSGVRPGLRVVLALSRRVVTEFGCCVASYFLDDRADLAVWMLALEAILREGITYAADITFAATASEEVGGTGALHILNSKPADICIALEIGPKTPEADFPIDSHPTIWVRDGYAAMDAADGEILTDCCQRLGQAPHWQYLSRGGSDASCAAANGLCARTVTLGIPVENSHGYEIMHRDAPNELVRLLLDYLKAAAASVVNEAAAG